MLGTFAMRRWVCRSRELLSKMFFASRLNVDSAPTVLRKMPIGCASYWNPSMNFFTFS